MAESILAYNSKTRIFPDNGYEQAQSCIIINFLLTTNPEKSNDKIFSKT